MRSATSSSGSTCAVRPSTPKTICPARRAIRCSTTRSARASARCTRRTRRSPRGARARRSSRATSRRCSRRRLPPSRATGRRSSTAGAVASAAASLAHVLNEIGWRAAQLEGGYRAYRRHVVAQLATLPGRFRYGSSAGRPAPARAACIAALDARARRCSTSKGWRGIAARCWATCPTTRSRRRRLSTASWWRRSQGTIRRARSTSSPRARRSAPCSCRTPCSPPCAPPSASASALPQPLRVELLKREYAHFLADHGALSARLAHLVPLHGKKTIERWADAAQGGRLGYARRRAPRVALRSRVHAVDRPELPARRGGHRCHTVGADRRGVRGRSRASSTPG